MDSYKAPNGFCYLKLSVEERNYVRYNKMEL